MKLRIDNGAMYANNQFFCYVEAGRGRTNLPNGKFEVAVSFSHSHGEELPQVHGIGWVGDDHARHDLVLGTVRARAALIPCRTHLERLIARLSECEEIGHQVSLEVRQ